MQQGRINKGDNTNERYAHTVLNRTQAENPPHYLRLLKMGFQSIVFCHLSPHEQVRYMTKSEYQEDGQR
jgi:hypothetical protein